MLGFGVLGFGVFELRVFELRVVGKTGGWCPFAVVEPSRTILFS